MYHCKNVFSKIDETFDLKKSHIYMIFVYYFSYSMNLLGFSSLYSTIMLHASAFVLHFHFNGLTHSSNIFSKINETFYLKKKNVYMIFAYYFLYFINLFDFSWLYSTILLHASAFVCTFIMYYINVGETLYTYTHTMCISLLKSSSFHN